MKIKSIIQFLSLPFFVLLFTHTIHAEEITQTDKLRHPSLGILLGANFTKLPSDFNFLIQGTSPYFWNRIAFRGSAGFGLIRGIPTTTTFSNEVALTYAVYKAGVIISADQPEDLLRPYTEMGLIMISPGKALSMVNWSNGFYATMGMDLMLDARLPFATFMELGAAALLSDNLGVAENLIGNPALSTGVFIQLGWRFYF